MGRVPGSLRFPMTRQGIRIPLARFPGLEPIQGEPVLSDNRTVAGNAGILPARICRQEAVPTCLLRGAELPHPHAARGDEKKLGTPASCRPGFAGKRRFRPAFSAARSFPIPTQRVGTRRNLVSIDIARGCSQLTNDLIFAISNHGSTRIGLHPCRSVFIRGSLSGCYLH